MLRRVTKITLESFSNLMETSNILTIPSKMDYLIHFWEFFIEHILSIKRLLKVFVSDCI